MTLSELRSALAVAKADRARIQADMHEIHARSSNRDLDPGEQTRWNNLERGFHKAEARIDEITLEMRAEVGDVSTVEHGDSGRDAPGNGGGGRTGGEARSRALRAVEAAPVPDDAKDHFAATLEEASGEGLSRLAEWTLATSDPDYLSAFMRMLADPDHGYREWSERELAAFRRVRAADRAMSLTDSAGGYLVPFSLDPSIILTSAGAQNPVRQLARKVTIATDVWHGVSSAGITASWDPEFTEVSDDTPTLAQPTIPVHKMAAFVPISIEAYEDLGTEGQRQVAMMLADAADTLEAEALQVGSGTNQPTGIVTALTGTASEVNQTGTTLDAPDFFAVQEALPARFQANASWLMHLVSLNRGRTIIAGTGLTTPLVSDDSSPPRLLGKPAYEASYMDSSVTGSASDFLVIYGDFSNYVVVDRVGTRIELVPHLFGTTNQRPIGARGWYMYRRVGGDSVNDNGFRMLDKSA